PPVVQALRDAAALDPARDERRALVGRARRALLEGKWTDAARMWGRALTAGHPPTFALGLLGLLAAIIHTDVEWLFRRTGRLSWPSRRHTAADRKLSSTSRIV